MATEEQPLFVADLPRHYQGAYVFHWGFSAAFEPPFLLAKRWVYPAIEMIQMGSLDVRRHFFDYDRLYAWSRGKEGRGGALVKVPPLQGGASADLPSFERKAFQQWTPKGGQVLDAITYVTFRSVENDPYWISPPLDLRVEDVAGLEIEARYDADAQEGEFAEIFLSINGKPFAPELRASFPFFAGKGIFQKYRIPLRIDAPGGAKITQLRLDLLTRPGQVDVSSVRWIGKPPRLRVEFPNHGRISLAQLQEPLRIEPSGAKAYSVILFTAVGANEAIVSREAMTTWGIASAPVGRGANLIHPLIHALDLGSERVYLFIEGLSEADNPMSVESASALIPVWLDRALLREPALRGE
jgi:hypothetical protein